MTLVEAGLGRCDDCRRHGLEAVGLSRNSSEPVFEALAHQALGFLELGLGRIDHAVSCLEGVVGVSDEQPDASALLVAGVADLADAYLRSGNRRGAEQMLARLSRGDYTGGQDGRVLLARTRCLLAPPDTFSRLFAFAVEECVRFQQPFERARCELHFGERLRRAGRRRDAREPLGRALATFESLSAEPWARRARQELGASGARARRRVDATRDELTTQERQVAELVGAGMTNREVAGQLFVTSKTIETHLRHIYRKLQVRSRTELARTLGQAAPPH